MPSKKAKGDEEPLKPLSFYVKDRLELTKQLFSCLKSKQIKSRLPANLQNKSMERIQQICLDEILGISSKRLLSIVNNTDCPADTESDSDIEHISLSEISSEEQSDDDIAFVENTTNKASDKNAGTSTAKPTEAAAKKGPNEPKTMLELIELEARARAIRSQLALEPVTKIELDDSEDEEIPEESPVTGPVKNNINPQSSSTKSSESSKKSNDNAKKTQEANKKSDSNDVAKKAKEIVKKVPEPPKVSSEIFKKLSKPEVRTEKPRKSPSPPLQLSPPPTTSRRIVVLKKTNRAELTITAPAPKLSAPPVKLKRNFIKTPSETTLSTTSETPKESDVEDKEKMTESRSSSPDVIQMEQNISTYFISDSDDDEPASKKKSPEKIPQKEKSVEKEVIKPQESLIENEKIIESPMEVEKVDKQAKLQILSVEVLKTTIESENIKETDPQEEIPSKAQEEIEMGEIIDDPPSEKPSDNDDDDNVVNLMMSDTEIDMNPSDKEDEESVTKKQSSTSVPDNKVQVEESKEVSQSIEYDDNVVEILHSEDEEGESSSKNPEETETWNQRYLRSSTVKNVLKTTKLASKVRDKLAANKKSQKEKLQKKKTEEKEKREEMKDKISKAEEGSLEQFQVLKESSN